jgi:predicted RNA-binding Zn ribbon-like protein
VESDSRWKFDLCGGHLAVDFANTVSARHSDSPIERLKNYAALVDFADQSGILERGTVARLQSWGDAHAGAAQAIVGRAVELREALHRLLSAAAAQQPPAREDLGVLNRWWHELELDGSFAWQWAAGDQAPDFFLGRVVGAAVELLTSPRRERIRLCDADDCVWLFVDTSKNRSRRWCDMNVCGNRMKARRFYRRHSRTSPPVVIAAQGRGSPSR